MVLLVLSLALTACNAPRGAGFQSEVLAASDATGPNGEDISEFGVFEITRDALPIVARWPGTGRAGGGDWIPASNQPANLLIAPGDVLKVSVWDAEDNSLLTTQGQRMAQLQDIQVSADGRIFVPFVGDIRVAGMAPATARKRIEEELVATVPSAQVQLSLAQGRSNTANLVSGVNSPGIYPLPDTDTTVLELIAQIKQDTTKTVLLVEHKMDVVRSLADRIIVLHNGALLADGPPDEVMNSDIVRNVYLGKSAEPA